MDMSLSFYENLIRITTRDCVSLNSFRDLLVKPGVTQPKERGLHPRPFGRTCVMSVDPRQRQISSKKCLFIYLILEDKKDLITFVFLSKKEKKIYLINLIYELLPTAKMLKSIFSFGRVVEVDKDSSTNSPKDAYIFPKVDPEVDGEDCDKDCSNCTTRYPSWFKINNLWPMYGYTKPFTTHVLVATGKSDWIRKVKNEEGSLMEAFKKSPKPTSGVWKS
jgi:hypothetical protein